MTPIPVGERLFGLVESYAALGDHRTGTEVDARTSQWFAEELENRGATVEMHPYEFDAYEADVTLTVAGRAIDALPLYYSAVGEVHTAAPVVAELEFLGGILPGDVDAVVTAALETVGGARETVVAVATRAHGDRLVALNRHPDGLGHAPAVLVAGGDVDALRTGPVHVEWRAELSPATSRNVVGRFGPPADDPVLVATPLSGWFACAGERGTGIAVALDTAAALAADHPVVVVGTSGHELENLGQRRLLPTLQALGTPRGAVHLGAGVGAGDPDGEGRVRPSELRMAMVAGVNGSETTDRLADALSPVGYDVGPGPGSWPGEGQALRTLGAPTLSLISGFERVHTRDDTPECTTSPEILASVSAGVLAAVRSLLSRGRV